MANAQTCTILPGVTKVCLGQSVSFSRTPLESTDSAIIWNFGNGSSSSQSGPIYQYTQAGNYTVTLRVYQKGGSFCDAPPVVIRVFDKPNARFLITPSRKQCFKNNNFIFNDLSTPGSSNAPIKRRTAIFGDGALLQQNAPFANSYSHAYTETNGSKYFVTLEVEDTNGCAAQVVDTVQVYKSIHANFEILQNQYCGYTTVSFRNRSLVDSIGLTCTWLLGNGQTLSNDTVKNFFYYTYTGDGVYYPRLVIKDKNGCIDTTPYFDSVLVFTPDPIIDITPTDKRCFSNNFFDFKNRTNLNSQSAYAWTFYNLEGNYQQDSLKRYINGGTFPWCGEFRVLLRFNYLGCSFVTDTQVTVYGPKAFLHDTLNIVEKAIQCGSHDTVRLGLSDLSCYYLNNNLTYLWDFGDTYAPACTTNTRLGLNLNMNCRYSTDSFDVKHFYQFPDKWCYTAKLRITDTVRMCSHETVKFLRLAYPKANWNDSVARAIAFTPKCIIKDITVFFNDLEPKCGPEELWFLSDTSCTNKAWELIAKAPNNLKKHEIPLSDICSSGPLAYFGVVVKNGLDALGNPCYDTGYYSYTLPKLLNPVFLKYEIDDPDLCAPHRLRFYVTDSIRKDLTTITYFFGDGSAPLVKNLSATDTIIESVYHTYTKNGTYSVRMNYVSKDTCSDNKLVGFTLGNEANLSVLTPEICTYNNASFYARLRYTTDTVHHYWSYPERADSSKEQVFWNYGDDDTWELGKENMSHEYVKPGIYYIKIAYKDSLGNACFDTLQGPQYRVKVNAAKALPTVTNDTFYCAPSIITFNDQSYGMHGDTIPQPLALKNRYWVFSDGKGASTLKQPTVFYGINGLYSAKLFVESVQGCFDTASVYVRVVGPTTKFVIVDDTFGCVPFTVKLRNQTGQQLRNWIWYFNDPAGSIYSTRNDSDITFTYNTPGVYKIDLLGEDSITNPTTQETKSCSERFPYLESPNDFHPRSITVLPIDTLKLLSPDSVCINQSFNTQVTGTLHNILTQWSWSDTVAQETWPINVIVPHTFDTAGVYSLKVEPIITSKIQCLVGVQKTIVAISPQADFNFTLSNYPEIQFVNQSQGAVRYLWDFGQPTSSQNSSTDINPIHNYGETLESFRVCLMAFDEFDCMDSICKIIPKKGSVKIPNVFTPDNNDDKNDAFDIDIEGWQKYELFIYNRWGTLVFEGFKDGIYNDGINWDGRDKNNGTPCPAGTYFVVFKYKLFSEKEDGVYHGTITLIRD
ncbi:MAG: PKD domain-containing protein [Bacteroidia bacterium]|nr:PKD domain-containing protein [Bacteroidia bacterium]MBP9688971.1 PKD domain-containing protein [Bacteroidia bacterium]